MATAVLVAVLGALAAALAAKWVLWYRRFRRLELAIPGPPSLPLVGNVLYFAGLTDGQRLARVLDKGRREPMRITLFTHLVLVLNNTDDIQQAVRRKDLADKSHFFYDLLHIVAKNGLITLNGPLWREHRRALQPAFSPHILEHFVDYFAEEAEGFVRRVRPGRPEDDLLDSLRRFTCATFLRTTLSEKVGADFEETMVGFIRFLELFLRHTNKRCLQPHLWNDAVYGLTAAGSLIRRTRATIDRYAHMVLNKRRAELRHQGALDHRGGYVHKATTVVDVLLQNHDGHHMSDEDAVDELKTFFAAGVDTTAATIMWLLKALSLHPDVQDKVHAEIQEVFEGSDRRVAPADLTRLEYTERFIKETLRMFPTVPFLARQVQGEAQVLGYTLPAGSTVLFNVLNAHRDPVHWPDPLRFDPDRFLPDQCQLRSPGAYMPFSSGHRNCIGGKYALMNMTAFLATTLRAFRVDPVDDGYKRLHDIPLVSDIALRADGGMTVQFATRATMATTPTTPTTPTKATKASKATKLGPAPVAGPGHPARPLHH